MKSSILPSAIRRLFGGSRASAPREAEEPAPHDRFELELASDVTPVVHRDGGSSPARIAAHAFRLGGHRVLVLAPGERLWTPPIALGPEHVLVIAAAGGEGPATVRLRAALEVRAAHGRPARVPLADLTLGAPPFSREQHVTVSLAAHAGVPARLVVECVGDAAGAKCHVATVRVGPALESGRMHAHRDYASRLQGEVRHFSNAYTHAMYAPSVSARGEGRAGEVGSANVDTVADARFVAEQDARLDAVLAALAPWDGESVFSFAMRCLGALLPVAPPDFAARAATLHPERPLRVLSLCAGAARIEEGMLLGRPGPLALTLLDASEELIRRAAERLQSARRDVVVRCLLGDVNRGLPVGDDTYDVILCVSALHHVANLEGVLAAINARLADDGEFWSVGEQIGRNGNRLWPEAKRAADAALAGLPERLRKNARTGQIDATLDDADFSANCFEGIRSEEIEGQLDAHLIPVEVYKRNAFLWRLVDTTYCDNYDLRAGEDVVHLKRLVRLEALHWVGGGRSTELYGIYRKKRIAS